MKIKVPQDIGTKNLTALKCLVAPETLVQENQVLFILEDNQIIHLLTPIAGKVTKVTHPTGKISPGQELLEIEPIGPEKSKKKSEEKTQPKQPISHKKEKKMSDSAGKVIPILMPKAGQSVEEATLLRWLVKPGDMIEVGQVIFEIETDKATMEVEATDSGRLARIVVQEGEVVPVLTPVAYIADTDQDVDKYLESQSKEEAKKEPTPSEIQTEEKTPDKEKQQIPTETPTLISTEVKASPAAKKLAKELNIDLRTVKGTGPDGRIILRDIESAQPQVSVSAEAIKRPLTPMRKAIAKNLTYSKQNVPHFYMKITIDADPIYQFYQSKRKEFKCSINDVLIYTCAKVLMEFPQFRSRLETPDTITEYPSANIGLAVAVENGLVVPVIMNAQNYDFKSLSAEARRIISLARQGKPENMGKGVFTISNLGMYDIDEFTAIINPPESAILAVGGIKENLIVKNGTIRIGKTMTLTISCDHRVVDGLLAAQFMTKLRQLLESPNEHIK